MNDQTAELLEQIEKDFMHRANVDAALTQFWKKAGQRKATQDDVADYAARLGELLSGTLQEHIVPAGDAGQIEERLQQLNVKSMVSHARQIAGVPEAEETEFHKTVKGTVDPMMKRAHTMINQTAAQVQKAIDEANGIGLNSVKAAYPQERIDGLIDKIAAPGNGADEVLQWLGEPVVNNCEKFFDEHVQANAAARFNLGMEPVIVRTVAPGCCDWCAKLAGAYPYDEVRNTGNDVYRRHQYCRCHVIFECDSKKQDVWSKKYYQADGKTLEERASYGKSTRKRTRTKRKDDQKRQERIAEAKRNREKLLAKTDESDTINVRYRIGQPVQPTPPTYETALNPALRAKKTAEKYGIHLRASGQTVNIAFDPDLPLSKLGRTNEIDPTTIWIGPGALASEESLASTIAHELNHCRSFLRGEDAPETPAYAAGDALIEYIRGER